MSGRSKMVISGKTFNPYPDCVTLSINASISLYEGEIELEQSGKTLKAPASIELNWLPSPSIRFEIRDAKKYGKAVPDIGRAHLKITELPLSCDANVTRVNYHVISGQARQVTLIRGHLLGKPIIFNASMCDYVLFCLPNFKSFAGGRLRLTNDEWEVMLTSNNNLSDLDKNFRDQGGFALTHTGRLKRVDAGQFNKEEASNELIALHYFLSFVRGLWCGPILASGNVGDKLS